MMAQRKLTYRIVHWHLRIPEDIAAQFEALFNDPFTGRTAYRVRNEFIVSLLKDYLTAARLKEPVL